MPTARTTGFPKFRVVWRSPYQVMLDGVDLTLASRAQWQRHIDQFAGLLQDDIYNEYAAERVAGRRLKRNDPDYDAGKAKQGYDTRRGHRENHIQRALGGSRLYTISFSGGRAFVTFSESRLQSRAPHAEYYAESKVQGGRILAFSRKQMNSVSGVLVGWVRGLEAKRRKAATANKAKTAAALRAAGTGLTRTQAATVRALTSQFEAQADFRRNAPFAGRPQQIRPGLGLTQAFLRRFIR